MTRRERRDQLILSCLSLAEAIARKISERVPPSFEFDDLNQAGCLGLIDAAERFEPSRNVPFRAFAARRIRGAILDSLRRRNWRNATLDELLPDHDMPREAGLDEAIDAERRAAVVQEAVEQLPRAERRLVVIHYREERRIRDASVQLRVTRGQASRLHAQALERLRAEIGRQLAA